ncbi:MAG: hypothetical protein NVV59_03625 [Chitinophagaceae bacterium]|nr:hypothetical protein [Chitinophagaceae bacterium]
MIYGKKENKERVSDWQNALGEMEALNCFANLAFNNEDFCMPVLTDVEEWEADSLGHPLIAAQKREFRIPFLSATINLLFSRVPICRGKALSCARLASTWCWRVRVPWFVQND